MSPRQTRPGAVAEWLNMAARGAGRPGSPSDSRFALHCRGRSSHGGRAVLPDSGGGAPETPAIALKASSPAATVLLGPESYREFQGGGQRESASNSHIRPSPPCLPLGASRGAGGRARVCSRGQPRWAYPTEDSLPAPAAVGTTYAVAFTGSLTLAALVEPATDTRNNSKHNPSFHS